MYYQHLILIIIVILVMYILVILLQSYQGLHHHLKIFLEFLLVILFRSINQELSLLLNFIKEFLLISKFLTSPNLSTGNFETSDELIQVKTFKNKYQSSFNKKMLVSL